MTNIQIIGLVIGGLFILSNFVDFKGLLSKMKTKNVDLKKAQDVTEPEEVTEEKMTTSVSDVVKQWERLRLLCEDANLNEAYAKLEEVFPLFVKRG